ncbi:MAG: hypothetical protein PHW47_07905 [Lachnospira sp.]|nr:hypothetical protein [Lachnospira sp.]
MYTLNVEKRAPEIKAKKIRQKGMVPCSISDGKNHETILIQIPESVAKKLLRYKSKGNQVELVCGDDTYTTIIKEVSTTPLSNQIENIAFQRLHEDEYVNSYARVVLKNKDKIQKMVYLSVPEIPYKALTQDLVEEVEIDLTTIKPGTGMMLRELSIWGNEKLKIMMKGDKSIVQVAN